MFRQRNRAFDGRKYRELAAFKPRKMIAHLELEVTQDQRQDDNAAAACSVFNNSDEEYAAKAEYSK